MDLATALTGEALQPLLQNQEFLDKVSQLFVRQQSVISTIYIYNFCNLGEGVPARWRGGEGGDPDRPLGHGPVPAVPAGRVHVQVSCDWSAGRRARL